MSEKGTFEVGQRVIAEDTEKAGVIRIVEPGANAYWYTVEFDNVTLDYPHSLLRADPADPAPTEPDEFADVRKRVGEYEDEVAYIDDLYGGIRAVPLSNQLLVDIRRLLDALDTVTRERDTAVKAIGSVIAECEEALLTPDAHTGEYTYVAYRPYEDILDTLDERGFYAYPTDAQKESDNADE